MFLIEGLDLPDYCCPNGGRVLTYCPAAAIKACLNEVIHFLKKHHVDAKLIFACSVLHLRCECYDYLFDIAVQMKQHGLDPATVPEEENGKLILWRFVPRHPECVIAILSRGFLGFKIYITVNIL